MKPTASRIALMRMVCADEVTYTRNSAAERSLWHTTAAAPTTRLRGQDARLDGLIRAALVRPTPVRLDTRWRPIQPTLAGRVWLAEHDR